jgi:hypothetical protein
MGVSIANLPYETPVWRAYVKSFRKVALAVSAITGALVLTGIIYFMRTTSERPSLSSDTGPILYRIQTLSSLTTLRAEVADAVVTQLQGCTGSVKAVLVVRGEITIGVDLSAAKFQSINRRARTAVLQLPSPRVHSARIDQERTKIVALWPTGLWAIIPGGDSADATTANLAYRDAQRVVAESANDPSLIPQARWQTERVLDAFFESMDWKVNIKWSG